MTDWWTSRRIAAVGSGASAAALLTPWVADVGAAGPGAVVLAVATTAGALAWRARLDRLPLVLSPVALVGEASGHPIFRFRARLGRGRPVQTRRVRLRWRPAMGPAVELAVLDPVDGTSVGPFTLVAIDRGRVVQGAGHLELELAVEADGQRWEARGTWARGTLRVGRFAAGVRRARGALEWDAAGWDAVVDDRGAGP